MTHSQKAFAIACMATTGFTAATNAATITYKLVKDDNGAGVNTPGSFAVYAIDSIGDNFGLASFGIDLTGTTTITNRAPQRGYVDIATGENTQKADFTLFRSASNVDPQGSQDTANSANDTVFAYGMGQTAGDLNALAPASYTTTTPNTQAVYGVPLLLAIGTYTDGAALGFNTAAGNITFANVFNNNTASVPFTSSAAVITQVTSVPEPTIVGLATVGGLGLFSRRRKV